MATLILTRKPNHCFTKDEILTDYMNLFSFHQMMSLIVILTS